MPTILGRFVSVGDLPHSFVWLEEEEPINTYSLELLLEGIRKAREESGGDLAPGWQLRVGDLLCDKYKLSDSCSPPRDHPVRHLGVGDLTRFVHTVKNWHTNGGKPVEADEAERRAAICADCPMNVQVKTCPACKRIASLLLGNLGDNSTSLDAHLKGCGVCGCDLKMKVWIPVDVLPSSTEKPENYPEGCWIREGLLELDGED